MIVHEAIASDYEAMRDLLHDSDAYHAQHMPTVARVPDEPRFTRAERAELIANDKCLVLVAAHEGEGVGFVDASIRLPTRPDEADQPWCGIHNLVVKLGWRRRGIGSMLVQAAEAWARDKGLAQVRLAVFEFNGGARALYERLGYGTISRWMGKSPADET
jgi:GNAT superfamily N-acetyltransferase